jgi:UPF0755 protein
VRRSRGDVLEWVEDPWDPTSSSTIDEFEEVHRAGRSPLRWLLAIVAVVVVAAAVAAGFGLLWLARQVNPAGEPGDRVVFTVADGETVEDVAIRLRLEGIIENVSVFQWYVDRRGGIDLQPGDYTIREGEALGEVIDILSTSPAETFTRVTFIEGSTLQEMAVRLEERMPQMSAEEFVRVATSGEIRSALQPPEVTSLEGLLFPDTYQIAGSEDEADVVSRMVRQMERVAAQLELEAADRILYRPGFTAYQALTVASMIEEEARLSEERPKISRVIYNRLNIGEPLGIDAVVLYGAPGVPRDQFGTALEFVRQTDSPYNSREKVGLPPTPISSPGRASIEAALAPSAGEWLYYVVMDEEGRHEFNVDPAAHQAAVERAQAAGLTN